MYVTTKKLIPIVLLLLCTFMTASAQAETPSNWGVKQPITFDRLVSGFSEPNMIYAPFTFWFWDEPITAGKSAQMARTMISQHFNPGYAHGRVSMVGTASLPDEEWLGKKWFDAFDDALKQAESYGDYLGYVDEYMWPCIQAHGRVVKANPDLSEQTLSWRTLDIHGGTAVHLPKSYFAVAARLAGRYGRSSAPGCSVG
jgi:hypothetical protein